MAKRRRAHGKASRGRKVMASSSVVLAGGRAIWEAPSPPGKAYEYGLVGRVAEPLHPLRRVVMDSVLGARECGHAIGMAIVGMNGQPDSDDPSYNGESTLTVSRGLLSPLRMDANARPTPHPPLRPPHPPLRPPHPLPCGWMPTDRAYPVPGEPCVCAATISGARRGTARLPDAMASDGRAARGVR